MIDVQAAGELGIPVANVPDFCVDEVSTQTLGFIIDLNRHTFELNEHVHRGHWGSQPVPGTAPRRLAGQTLGIVGLGTIGCEVARKALAFGVTILARDPYLETAPAGVRLVELDELLAASDYVTLHCPLVPETRGLIGARQLATMKPTAYLLNLSRGPVVEQSALADALTSGVIAGAALDVMADRAAEPGRSAIAHGQRASHPAHIQLVGGVHRPTAQRRRGQCDGCIVGSPASISRQP